MLDGVSANALDERTLEIRLRRAAKPLPEPLAEQSFFAWPRHLYEREGRDWHRAVPLVGNGPYVLTSRDENCVVLASAPSWYGARGNVGEVTIELEASPAVAVDRWRRGEYDVLHEMLAFRAVATDEDGRGAGSRDVDVVSRLQRETGALDDARVRRALAHAIDRRGPAETLRAAAAGTGGIIPPGMPGHSHRVAPAFDPDRARALLGEAGYADGRALGEIGLAYLDLWEDAASDVAAQLAAVGVRVRLLSTASDPELEAVIEERAHHCFIWAWGAIYPDPGGVYRPKWTRIGRGSIATKRLEQLLTRAASLRDQDERLRTYREFERGWIGEQAAVVALAYENRHLWRRPWVTGMWMGAIEGADSTSPTPSSAGLRPSASRRFAGRSRASRPSTSFARTRCRPNDSSRMVRHLGTDSRRSAWSEECASA